MKYRTRLDIPGWLQLDDIHWMLEKLQEQAGATLLTEDRMPFAIMIEYDLEPEQDAWDLHEIVLTQQQEISDYVAKGITIPRPTPVQQEDDHA